LHGVAAPSTFQGSPPCAPFCWCGEARRVPGSGAREPDFAEISMPRDKIILACSDCKNRNYFTTKNKRLHPERVEWKKYCPRCNKHVVHKETK
jgi:large subunit ribosomal protein L33